MCWLRLPLWFSRVLWLRLHNKKTDGCGLWSHPRLRSKCSRNQFISCSSLVADLIYLKVYRSLLYKVLTSLLPEASVLGEASHFKHHEITCYLLKIKIYKDIISHKCTNAPSHSGEGLSSLLRKLVGCRRPSINCFAASPWKPRS